MVESEQKVKTVGSDLILTQGANTYNTVMCVCV